MEIHNLLKVKSRTELREWLLQNHDKATECWVVVRRGRPKEDGTFWYIDAVEEALCFGWIDSTTKKLPDNTTVQKLCPRKPRNFCQLPDLYKRVRIDTIQIKKRQPELFKSRLSKFIENTRKGILYGEWNDNGRL